MKRRDLVKLLEANGFRKVRDVGDHTIYAKPNGPSVSVPRHREINRFTAVAILKAAGIDPPPNL